MSRETNAAALAFALDLAMRAMTHASAIRAAAQQSGEWTPEEEAAFKEKKRQTFASPAWQDES